jgi:hypothetical protein
VITGAEPPITRFAHHSVSAQAIRTNPLFRIPHFETDVYPYCPFENVVFKPEYALFDWGSVGILFIHADINPV